MLYASMQITCAAALNKKDNRQLDLAVIQSLNKGFVFFALADRKLERLYCRNSL